jgi:glycosyltransferase involved in cell wall biosynthesis
MDSWLDLAEQIVVVDSHSNDGTWELIQEKLFSHPRISFHQRPRGLYESWNYGVEQVCSEFLYISTVGDHITKEGLQNLIQVAHENSADVVISPPAFIEEDGSPSETPPLWPVNNLINCLKIEKPKQIDNWTLLVLCLKNPIDAILGSSASNIYRTTKLQERPFPTNFGSVGDSVWAISNIFDFKLAVTPECFSVFRQHEKSYRNEIEGCELGSRLCEIIQLQLEKILACCKDKKQRLNASECMHLNNLVRQRIEWQRKLESSRNLFIPWTTNPWAWYFRYRRNKFSKIVNQNIKDIISFLEQN